MPYLTLREAEGAPFSHKGGGRRNIHIMIREAFYFVCRGAGGEGKIIREADGAPPVSPP